MLKNIKNLKILKLDNENLHKEKYDKYTVIINENNVVINETLLDEYDYTWCPKTKTMYEEITNDYRSIPKGNGLGCIILESPTIHTKLFYYGDKNITIKRRMTKYVTRYKNSVATNDSVATPNTSPKLPIHFKNLKKEMSIDLAIGYNCLYINNNKVHDSKEISN